LLGKERKLLLRQVRKINNFINVIEQKILILLLTCLTVLTTVGVIYRYVLKSPLTWLYETTVVIFSWMVFVGVSSAFKRDEHIKLGFLVEILPLKIGKIIKVLINLTVIIFLVLGVKYGFQIVRTTAAQVYNTINLSTAWFYAAFPVSAVFIIWHLLAATFELICGKENLPD
jgi:TRAP-type C4-dicarboxylate transport system permease small subunit